MVHTHFSPEVWAIILAAFLGAIIGQFLSFYRKRRRDLEELKATLYLIAQLNKQDIDSKINRDDSVLWYLREELYQRFKSNILYLRDAHKEVLTVIRLYPSKQMDDRIGYTAPSELQQAAKKAFESLEQIKWYQLVWQSILGFLGLSQQKYADVLNEYLETTDKPLEGQEPERMDSLEVEDREGVEPAEGLWISSQKYTVLKYIMPILLLGVVVIIVLFTRSASTSKILQTGLLAGAVGMVIGIVIMNSFYHFLGRRVTRSNDTPKSDITEEEITE